MKALLADLQNRPKKGRPLGKGKTTCSADKG